MHHKVEPSLLSQGTCPAFTRKKALRKESCNVDKSNKKAMPSLVNSCYFSPVPPTTPCPRATKHTRRHEKVLKRSSDTVQSSPDDTEEEKIVEDAHETIQHQDHHTQYNHHHHHHRRNINSDSRKHTSQVKGAVQCPTCTHWMVFQAENEAVLEKIVKREMFLQEEEALKQHLAKEKERYEQAML